uniref:F-box domain-containing protein n=1 Tax=Ditylenchus dipsaci TaxID=166011 RepID=A0A915DE18_9BILA
MFRIRRPKKLVLISNDDLQTIFQFLGRDELDICELVCRQCRNCCRNWNGFALRPISSVYYCRFEKKLSKAAVNLCNKRATLTYNKILAFVFHKRIVTEMAVCAYDYFGAKLGRKSAVVVCYLLICGRSSELAVLILKVALFQFLHLRMNAFPKILTHCSITFTIQLFLIISQSILDQCSIAYPTSVSVFSE